MFLQEHFLDYVKSALIFWSYVISTKNNQNLNVVANLQAQCGNMQPILLLSLLTEQEYCTFEQIVNICLLIMKPYRQALNR